VLNSSQHAEQLSFSLIATYPEMAKVCENIVKQENINFHNIFAAFGDAANAARKIEAGVDAILSRGGTAEFIRKSVDIPVITIPIAPFDVVRSMYHVPKHIKEVAFFNFRRKIYGIRDIEKMFEKNIYEYTFMDQKDIEIGVKDAQDRGIRVLIGGVVAVRLAQQMGMVGIEISSGEEAVYHAVHEAIHVVQVRRSERSRSARLKVVFDSIAEGIVVTDEHDQIVVFNPAAARIFSLSESEVMGKSVDNVIPDTGMSAVFKSGKSEMACLQKIHDGIFATNRVPIFLDSKPIGVVSAFEDVTKIQNLEQQIRKQMHAKGFVAKHTFGDILTNNPRMIELKELAALYASTQSSVLIEGESGTGKELFAQSIHNASKRVGGPFVAVNCAAIPEHLLESELFGYEGGAFTGAKKEGKQGLFEMAHNGTIFLDEIGEIPKSLQARLLRILQEKEIMRVGGDKIVPVDIRIISATNKNLKNKLELGEFRDDLYYRLNVFNLKLTPLRERREDISLLGVAFLRMNRVATDTRMARELMHSLHEYDWPGNIRELHNIMERLSLLIRNSREGEGWAGMLEKVLTTPVLPDDDSFTIRVHVGKGLKDAMGQAEKSIVNCMLVKYNQDQRAVAKRLGIGRTTLWRKAKI
jgi:transcriptional regulator, propionate catabolism operon regulatory protein